MLFHSFVMTWRIRACLASLLLSPLANVPAIAETVAYYRFEQGPADMPAGTIQDSSGNGLTGVAINSPIYRSDIPTDPIPLTSAANQYSIDFNGSNQRVFVPDYSELGLTQSFTIEAYVFLRGQAGPSDNIVFRGDDRISLDPYVMNCIGSQVGIGITNASNQSAGVATTMIFNQWVHIAAVLNDAGGTLSIYLNGALANSISTPIRPFATLDPNSTPGLGIGNVQSSNYDQYFNGLIDEVRISNEALSPGQFLNAPEPSLVIPAMVAVIATCGRRRGRN